MCFTGSIVIDELQSNSHQYHCTPLTISTETSFAMHYIHNGKRKYEFPSVLENPFRQSLREQRKNDFILYDEKNIYHFVEVTAQTKTDQGTLSIIKQRYL